MHIRPALVTCTTVQHSTWLDESACTYDDALLVFRCRLSDCASFIPYLSGLLQPDELTRARRYRQQTDQQRSICTRGMLRILSGKYTQQAPHTIQFTAGINKKPMLTNETNVHINASHAGDWILLAIGRVSVGVDVEMINPHFSFTDLLSPSFSTAERQSILGSVDARQSFYRLWTRKEALVKATGKGLDNDFSQIPSLDGEHHPTPALLGQTGNWLVCSFALADTYSAAVAYEATGGKPQFYMVNEMLSFITE